LPIGSAGSVWRFSKTAPFSLPRQGWKIHVSATILNAAEVLRLVGEIVSKREIIFKGISTISEFSKLNSGLYYGYSQIGKLLTIYCSPQDQIVLIAQELAQVLTGQPGPAVPFEARVLQDSPVFARFGLFESDEGSGALLQAPDGSQEPDRRDANPVWATPPTGLFGAPSAAKGPLSSSYRAYGFISQRGKGGVYRALDLKTVPPRHCVLKEGRRYGEVDLDCCDGYSRVSQELAIMLELEQDGVPIPKVYADFEQSGNKYLVFEWMPGGSLGERLYSPDTGIVELKEALDFCLQAARIVARIHDCGWVWRDLKSPNLLIDSHGALRPIDFEGAAKSGSSTTTPWGSPGHIPPEWERMRFASFTQDQYALGAVMRQILTKEAPGIGELPPIRQLRPEIPEQIERLVADLMREDPERRPTAVDAASIIEEANSRVR
jgi:tRNA A-37 threonylcarbamoyl transferase component Bud32